ncbi:hybrid sensor histidine kinase/response regulator [Halobiforma nitratireducens]|uniref:histidine kinase n=1 Tax=Halobiforma nitratireducens JCM 10879 TaxID=1227454 RepID=M0LCX8_9EURY|nr:PAS domain S-box protein [Halobiforma nitratireducens]EMA31431.1 HTR-like protein [Halobiforma nitratireducens JCM 10879]
MTDPIRVLHVDDEPDFAELAGTFLERENERLTVETATSVDDGLDRIESENDKNQTPAIDCIVSDYDMPEQNGLEFLEQVRTIRPEMPFILFTGNGSEAVASDAISAGVTDYFRKATGTSQYAVLANRIENAVERRRYRTQAERSRRRLTELCENIPDCIWLFDGEWEELLFISGYERVWGRSADELESDPTGFFRHVHPDNYAAVEAKMERLSEGEPVDHEYRIQRGEDENAWVWTKAEPIVDDDGEVVRVAGFTRDITERKVQERELETLTQRYREYVENGMDVITVLEADGTIRYESSAIERLLGYEPDELVGENAFDYVHPNDRDRVVESISSLTERGDQSDPNRERIEFRFQREDGSWVWLESVGSTAAAADGDVDIDIDIDIGPGSGFGSNHSPLRDPDDDSDVFLINSRTITERKERERTLSALHTAARRISSADEPTEVYETLTETAEGILEFDLVAIDVERDGYLVQEAWTLGVEDRQYYDRTSLEEDTIAVQAYKRQETIVVDDVRNRDAAPADPEYRSGLTIPIGKFGTFQAVASKVKAFDRYDREFAELLVGHAEVKLSQLQDERTLRERTRELERQNERLDEFVSVVSHDLRNPVSVAKGNLELARETDRADGTDPGSSDDEQEDGSDDANVSEYLEEVEWALDRIDGLIKDLLTLARDGNEIGERERIDLASVAHQCWRGVATADATLEVDIDRTIAGDDGRLRQLFENLMRNAVEHGGPDVTVTIGELESDDCEGFYVADDGPGVPESAREHVFDAGYSTSDDGAGFGLYIVKQVVEAHGWDVRVIDADSDADADDSGTRFEITGVEFR